MVVINSPDARRGLEIERSMIADGISPEGVTQYKEQEVGTVFLGGDKVFMRKVSRFFALPVAEGGLQGYSSLGGWNFFINANTRDTSAAYEFSAS